jgi:hypothetical protein
MYFNGITSRRRLLASLKIMEDKALEPIIKDLSDSSLVTAIEENLFAMFHKQKSTTAPRYWS